jgi:hypothetical protein
MRHSKVRGVRCAYVFVVKFLFALDGLVLFCLAEDLEQRTVILAQQAIRRSRPTVVQRPHCAECEVVPAISAVLSESLLCVGLHHSGVFLLRKERDGLGVWGCGGQG